MTRPSRRSTLAAMLLPTLAVFAAGAAPHRARAQDAPLPRSHLATPAGGAWRTWWRSDAAPARWPAARADVARQVRWRAGSGGVEWGTLALAGTGEAWRLRVVLVRIDPARHRVRLATAGGADPLEGRWSVDSVPGDALAALNAGQFRYGTPWGWVVDAGEELLPPRRGPLAMALAVDSAGRVHWIDDTSIDSASAAPHPEVAFQSYPALLVGDGDVPAALRTAGAALDVAHRDARLAIGELRDGRLLVALTRFDAVGESLGFVPFGPTVPEMAAVMGALGCRRAMLLDGGISSQLMVRESAGRVRAWRAIRRVPLGIVVVPRATALAAVRR